MMSVHLVKFLILIILMTSSICVANKNVQKNHQISERALPNPWLLYATNAATGILVAIAVPLHDLDRNVFMSYNFEANYNMPGQPEHSYPGPPYVRWKLGSTYEDMSVNPAGDASVDSVVARGFSEKNKTVEESTVKDDIDEEILMTEKNKIDLDEHEIDKRSLSDRVILTRKGVYRLLENRIAANGIDGKKCLLRAICESAANSFLDANGVLGHLLHIILTPSTSIDENLPSEYSKAEILGYKNDCTKYIRKCTISLIDSITTFI